MHRSISTKRQILFFSLRFVFTNIKIVYLQELKFGKSMKFFFSICLIFYSTMSFAQVGITVGATNYITKTDLLFSKSSPGFTLGIVGGKEISERFDFLIEINYNRHRMSLIGKADELAAQEDIKFFLQEFSCPFVFNYYYLIYDDFKFGINFGPSFHFSHNLRLVDDSKTEYLMEPLLVSASELEFDAINRDISTNVFLATGLSVKYNFFMLNLKYYYGVTDPYRKARIASEFLDISGKDAFFTITLTAFL